MNALEYTINNSSGHGKMWAEQVAMILKQYGLVPRLRPTAIGLLRKLPEQIKQVFSAILMSAPRNSVGEIELSARWLAAQLNAIAGDYSQAIEDLHAIEWSLDEKARHAWTYDRVLFAVLAGEDLSLISMTKPLAKKILERMLPGVTEEAFPVEPTGLTGLVFRQQREVQFTSEFFALDQLQSVALYSKIKSPFLAPLIEAKRSDCCLTMKFARNSDKQPTAENLAGENSRRFVWDLARGVMDLNKHALAHNVITADCVQYNAANHCWQLTGAQPAFDDRQAAAFLKHTTIAAMSLQNFDPRLCFQGERLTPESDYYALGKLCRSIPGLNAEDEQLAQVLDRLEGLHPQIVAAGYKQLRELVEGPKPTIETAPEPVDGVDQKQSREQESQKRLEPRQHRVRSVSQPGVPNLEELQETRYRSLPQTGIGLFKEALRILTRPASIAEARFLAPARRRFDEVLQRLTDLGEAQMVTQLEARMLTPTQLNIRREMLVMTGGWFRAEPSSEKILTAPFLIESRARLLPKVTLEFAINQLAEQALELPLWSHWQYLSEVETDLQLPRSGFEWLRGSRRQGRGLTAEVVGFKAGSSGNPQVFKSQFSGHRPANGTSYRGLVQLYPLSGS